MSKLDQTRENINHIDKEMAKLFEKRMQAIDEVVAYKMEHKMEVLDNSREKKLIEKNMEYVKDQRFKESYLRFLKVELCISKDYQKSVMNKDLIGYQGTFGAFAYIASNNVFPNHTYKAFPTWEDVMKAVESKEIRYGVIPFENSYTGEVGEVSDLLREHNVYITKIYDLKVDQNLLGVKGSSLDTIKKVYSHPQALSQSSLFLKGRNLELIPYANTALAAEFVGSSQDQSLGAIASKETAELFDLEIIEANIHASMENTTRFIVIGNQIELGGNRFQILFTTNNETGALANAMNLIASYGFNMESIRSRAIPHKPWSYYFHVELEGVLEAEKTKEMLKALDELCIDIKILGSYTK